MITARKLSIYRKYEGDPDAWVRSGSRREKNAISDQDWAEIAELESRLRLVESGLASPEFEQATSALLKARAEDEVVARRVLECT